MKGPRGPTGYSEFDVRCWMFDVSPFIPKKIAPELSGAIRKKQLVAAQDAGMISIPLISGFSVFAVKPISSLPSVISTFTVSI
jgi:hypothetical protein